MRIKIPSWPSFIKSIARLLSERLEQWADAQAVQPGLRAIITRGANHLFCSNMATVSAAFTCWSQVWENKRFYCAIARRSSGVCRFNGFVFCWVDSKVDIRCFHVVTLIVKIPSTRFFVSRFSWNSTLEFCLRITAFKAKTGARCPEPCSV